MYHWCDLFNVVILELYNWKKKKNYFDEFESRRAFGYTYFSYNNKHLIFRMQKWGIKTTAANGKNTRLFTFIFVVDFGEKMKEENERKRAHGFIWKLFMFVHTNMYFCLFFLARYRFVYILINLFSVELTSLAGFDWLELFIVLIYSIQYKIKYIVYIKKEWRFSFPRLMCNVKGLQ